jgi:hypothetical protein
MTTIAPPPELDGADLVALVIPFGEPADPGHPEAGQVIRWGAVPLPREAIPLREEHDDDGPEIGLLSSFVLTRDGIWAAVKAGRTAEALIARGVTGISAEIDEGRITGAALTDSPAFPSARVWAGGLAARGREPDVAPAGPVSVLGEIARQADRSGGVVVLAPKPPPRPAPSRQPAVVDGGRERELLDSMSMAAVHAEVEVRRGQFDRWREGLATMAEQHEEEELLAAGVPMSLWPAHTSGRQRYDAHVAAQVAERAQEYEGERLSQLFAYQLAAAAVPSPRRRWWRRWLRWPSR